jgi:hypothetical protein
MSDPAVKQIVLASRPLIATTDGQTPEPGFAAD